MTSAAQKFDPEAVTRLLLHENCPDELDFGAYASVGPAADIENRALDRRNHRRPLRKEWFALPSAQMDLLMSKLHTCTNVTKVDFSGFGLGERGTAALCAALRGHSALEYIDLEDCSIQAHGASALAELLQGKCSLKHINLSYCGTFYGRDVGDVIAQSLQGHIALESVVIREAILQVLQQHPALKFIDLNGTYPLPEMNRHPGSYLRLLEDYQRLLFSLLPLRALEHVDLGSGYQRETRYDIGYYFWSTYVNSRYWREGQNFPGSANYSIGLPHVPDIIKQRRSLLSLLRFLQAPLTALHFSRRQLASVLQEPAPPPLPLRIYTAPSAAVHVYFASSQIQQLLCIAGHMQHFMLVFIPRDRLQQQNPRRELLQYVTGAAMVRRIRHDGSDVQTASATNAGTTPRRSCSLQ